MGNVRVVKVRSLRAGGYSLAAPGTEPGPETMTYAIASVPSTVSDAAVLQQMRKITFVHSLDSPRGWAYDWSELEGKPAGSIINRRRGRPLIEGEGRTERLQSRITPTMRAEIDKRGGDAWVVGLIEQAINTNPATGTES